MKISESWLREWVNPALSTDALVHALTMAGLEVDGVEPAAPEFSGVVVGQIESVDAHPDAEKLRVCQVTDAGSTYQVVCGASNAEKGIKIPFAKPGAHLPGGIAIKKAKLRGIESFGMLCGGSELGLEDIIDGLLVLPDDAPIGDDFREYLNLDDAVIEVDLTPNRGDCLSVLGIAREAGVLSSIDLNFPNIEPVAAKIDDIMPVTLSADDYCPRYVGRVIKNLDMQAETPLWMREKLRRAGLRSIDAVVDVTNYVLLELGQPMHAFDLAKIDSAINVRRANAGESITCLDGSEVDLSPELLVIADSTNALAIAGIMGGESSAVSNSTKDILLESAFFEPTQHAGKARQLGMHTDSSHRFERGVDLAGQQRAIERATQLLIKIAGGEPGPVNVAEADQALPASIKVNLQESQIARVLGFKMDIDQVTDIFTRLDLQPQRNASGWQITVPSHRFDIAIEADLLEELARIYGYDKLPVEPPLAAMSFSLKPESKIEVNRYKQLLVDRGYREAITYSFIDPKMQQIFFPEQSFVELSNPIASDMSVMRTSLLPGLVGAAIYNLSRQQRRLKLFESGLSFQKSTSENTKASVQNPVVQEPMVAGVLCGERKPEAWLSKSESVNAKGQKPDNFDFYDVKADVEALLALSAKSELLAVEFRAVEAGESSGYLHPGQSADIYLFGEKVGVVGLLHPQLQKALDISVDIWVFEFKLNLISEKKVPKFKELSKFPEVRRDLAIIVEQTVSVGNVVSCARQNASAELVNLAVFDQYGGEGVGDGMQSIGLGLTWQHAERTLNDEEVTSLTDEVIAALSKEFNASLR